MYREVPQLFLGPSTSSQLVSSIAFYKDLSWVGAEELYKHLACPRIRRIEIGIDVEKSRFEVQLPSGEGGELASRGMRGRIEPSP